MSLDDIARSLRNSVILLVGSPLSGKSTQGKLLGKVLQRPYVSTGDLFRDEVRTGSILGQEMKRYMDNGELIPNELTTTFLTRKFNDPLYEEGMILDGYPRNLSHLPIFKQILSNLNRKVYAVIYFNVSKEILDQRREGRNRTDDDQNVFQRRYEIFRQETIPLVHFFQAQNLLIEIPSDHQSIEEIHQLLCQELTKFQQQK